jgi:multicomponent Na+:H+ antiporter subunit C
VTTTLLYGLVAVGIFGLALHSLVASRHVVPRLIAANVMSSGVFLLFVALASRGEGIDPVPLAMVLTGIVVAVAATGFALVLIRRIHAESGRAVLPEDEPANGEDRGEDRGGKA